MQSKYICSLIIALSTNLALAAANDEVTLAKRFNIPKENMLVWEETNSRYQGKFSLQQEQAILDTLNYIIEKQIQTKSSFTPPKKDEYEKTADYEIRLNKAKSDYNNSPALKDPARHRFNLIKEYFNPLVGTPKYPRPYMAEDYSYNADSETLTLQIRSQEAFRDKAFSVPVKISMPPQQAKEFENYLDCMPPKIIMEWSPPKLIAKYAVLDIGAAEELCAGWKMEGLTKLLSSFPVNHPVKKGIPLNYTLPATFDKVTEQEYLAKINKNKEADTKKRDAEIKAKRWYPLYSKIKDNITDCKVIKSNVVTLDMTSGEQKAYESLLGSQKRYPICFR